MCMWSKFDRSCMHRLLIRAYVLFSRHRATFLVSSTRMQKYWCVFNYWNERPFERVRRQIVYQRWPICCTVLRLCKIVMLSVPLSSARSRGVWDVFCIVVASVLWPSTCSCSVSELSRFAWYPCVAKWRDADQWPLLDGSSSGIACKPRQT